MYKNAGATMLINIFSKFYSDIPRHFVLILFFVLIKVRFVCYTHLKFLSLMLSSVLVYTLFIFCTYCVRLPEIVN